VENMPLNIDWQQILLHLLNFVLLFFGLYFLLYAPVKDFMESRKKHYEDMDNEAKNVLEEAKKQKEIYTQKFKDFEEEMKQYKLNELKKIDDLKEETLNSAKKESEKIISKAKITAEKEYSETMKKAQKEISGLVTEAAEKFILKADDACSFDDFLDAAERGDTDEK